MQTSTVQLISTLSMVANDGATRAGRGLSGLVGQEIAIHVPSVRPGTRVDACNALGGEETTVFGAYLSFNGDITGHVVLLFPVEHALACVDLMSGQSVGTTTVPAGAAESAMGELGNIVGSAFINALADHTNLILHPSPPTILHDMAIAIVESVYAEVRSQDGDAIIVDTVFEDANGLNAGMLILALDPVCLERVQELAA